MKAIHLAISCAGSGIGQSIVDSCKLSDLPLVTYGFDCNPRAYGIYDCDQQVLTPRINDPKYISEIIEICRIKGIDIFIPGTDHDVHLVSKHVQSFNEAGIEVIVSSPEFVDIVRDKEQTSTVLNKVAPLFVKSYRKDAIFYALQRNEVDFPLIAKPLGGSGSVGIQILLDRSDLAHLKDDDVVQELAVPATDDINYSYFMDQISLRINPQVSELSIHMVTDRNGRLMGRMVTYNKLKSGVPIEILPYENEEVWQAIEPLIEDFIERGWRGPLNIQGRLTDNGLKLYEMNARFTGISGLRAHLGFNEVDACIRSWLHLDDKRSKLTFNPNLFGLRQTSNKVVHLSRSEEVSELVEILSPKETKNKQTLLITGSTTYLGLNLLETLSSEYPEDYHIWVLSRDVEKAKYLHSDNVRIFGFSDLEQGKLPIGNVDFLIHTAFSRPFKSKEDIANSLRITSKLFSIAAQHQVAHIINVSSQSVYGRIEDKPLRESSKIAPESIYGHAKYSAELMLKELCRPHKQIKHTSLRLPGLTGAANGILEIDPVSELVRQLKNGEDLQVDGELTAFDRLDIRDAVAALIAFISKDDKNWKSVYNVGNPNHVNSKELSEKVLKIGKDYIPDNRSILKFHNTGTDAEQGMDSSQFMEHTGWSPKYSLEETIDSLFRYEH
ncbi:MAG: NAD-dependent epimerase/dehydratase family protein [Flavobacteriaceae bacterium]|nr:NAD-dependent epimerase/dehydratase family protein [Flavobacteriaceae bacterium]